MFVLGDWTHHMTGRYFVEYYILLPYGVLRQEHFNVNVHEGGNVLELTVLWLNCFSNLDIIQKVTEDTAQCALEETGKQPDEKEIPLILGAIAESYKMLRPLNNAPITHYHTIDLPIQVETHFAGSNTVETTSSGTLLHVRLNGLQDKYVSGAKKTGKLRKVTL